MSKPARRRRQLSEREAAHWIFVKQCLNKRRYKTSREAQCVGFNVYRCPWCDGYHRATDRKYLNR